MPINLHFGLDRYNFTNHINFLLYFFVFYFLISLDLLPCLSPNTQHYKQQQINLNWG